MLDNRKNGKKTLVGSVYRSTSSTPENNRRMLVELARANEIARDNRILILGDFNVPKVNWVDMDVGVPTTPIDRQLLEVATDEFFIQHVTMDTRFDFVNDTSSLLDLIFTREEGDVKNVEVLHPLGKSDHGVVIADYVCEWKSNVQQKPRRLYHKGNYELINRELNLVDWGGEFENKTIQECWDIFKAKLEILVEKYIPMSKPKDFNAPWMNIALMRLWRKKHFAFKRYNARKSRPGRTEYKKRTANLKDNTRKAKRKYERKLAKEARQNKRAFFRYVNSKLTVRPELNEIRKENGEMANVVGEVCDTMGDYFNTVHTPKYIGTMPDMNEMYETEIRNIVISRENVQNRLEKLNVNKSCGPDNIHPFVLRAAAGAISIPLEIIFNKSMSTGECPTDWRSANVTPIHKKGDRTVPSNYRPVSLTSQVCKVLESIVKKHILEHLTRNNILSDMQHGFREGRSCLTNLLDTLEMWTETLSEENGIDVAYLDFRKAFDLVSHRHLLHKMAKYGITQQILNWVAAFLDSRTQRVVIRGTTSKAFDVTSGVPQGSVLGPVLFLIFINDLPLEVISPMSLFADDSKVFTKIITNGKAKKKNDNNNLYGNEALQRDLDNIQDWARRWKMEFNVDKCKIMHLGSKNQKHTYTMGGRNLAVTTEERDLGILIDDKLNFESHIKGIVKRANRMLGLIKIGFECLDMVMFKNLYPVMVRPLLEYCVQVWSPYKCGDIDLLERVQRRATRIVPELRNLPYEERMRRLKLTSLTERRARGDMIETYKLITRKENVNPDKFFKMADIRGDIEIHHGLKISKKGVKGERRKHFYTQRVVDPWNGLPPKVVQAKSVGAFKKGFDKEAAIRRRIRENSIYVSGIRGERR